MKDIMIIFPINFQFYFKNDIIINKQQHIRQKHDEHEYELDKEPNDD